LKVKSDVSLKNNDFTKQSHKIFLQSYGNAKLLSDQLSELVKKLFLC